MKAGDSRYDVIVIGSGTAGITVAYALRDAGRRVAVIDREPFGGTCALRGCQPKKYLVVNTHLAADTRALLGRGFSEPAVTDWGDLQSYKHEFTDPVPVNTVAACHERGIDTRQEAATFVDSNTVALSGGDRLEADAFVIATGSRSRPLTVPGAELTGTSDDFLDLTELPRSMVCIGGGYISLEFAFVAALSGVKVTILQNGDRILPQFPASLVDRVMEAGTRHGIAALTGVNVTRIARNGDALRVETAAHGTLDAGFVLAAIGRIPNVEGLALEKIGVTHGPRGISVDERMRTTVQSIRAIGDCAATQQLAPIADYEALVAARTLLGDDGDGADYRAIPSVVFTHPQMASVGLSVDAAERARTAVRVKRGTGERWANYRRLNADTVYYETVVDPESDLILGAHLVGPYAGEQINLFALAIREGVTAHRFRTLPWAYPTYTSDVKYMV